MSKKRKRTKNNRLSKEKVDDDKSKQSPNDEEIKVKRKKLLRKTNKLPNKLGVYAWLNKDGKPVYIGRSNNVKERTKTHIETNKSGKKDPQQIARDVSRVVYKYTQTPGDARKQESMAIRAYKPKYNTYKIP